MVVPPLPRSKVSFFALGVSCFALLLAVAAFLHWLFWGADASGFTGVLTQIGPLSSGSIFLSALSLFCLGGGRLSIARRIGMLLCLLSFLLVVKDVFPVAALPEYGVPASTFINVLNFDRQPIPLTAIAFALLGAGVIFISLQRTSERLVVIGSILGLCSISIASLGFYSFVFLPRAQYGLVAAAQIPPLLALCAVSIAGGIVLVGWARFDSQRNASIQELLSTIEIVAGAGIALLAFTCSFIGLLTWYHSYQHGLQDQLNRLLIGKVALVQEYLGRIKDTGDQIATAPSRINLMEAVQRNSIDQNEYRVQIKAGLERALLAAPSLLGITRVHLKEQIRVSVGIPVPARLSPYGVARRPTRSISFPIRTKVGRVFVVKTPIFDAQEQLIGADFLLVSVGQLNRPFLDEGLLGGTGRVFIGALRQRRLVDFQLVQGPQASREYQQRRSDKLDARAAMRKAIRHNSGVVGSSPNGSQVLFYVPIIASDWGLVFGIKTNEVRAKIQRPFIEVVLAAGLLGIIGTALFSLLLRTLFMSIFRLEEQRALAQMQINESLKEKEILLKEIHHRVKNNLQVISSIFSLQKRRTTDPKLTSLLEESQGRVQSIALLHETLYRSQSFSRISMQDYLEQLIAHQTRALASGLNIEGVVDAVGVALELDKAIPCGLIINELITNALKHGYPSGFKVEKKQFSVTLVALTDQEVELRVKDNGIGIRPDAFENEKNDSLGLRLIKALSKQLSGEIKIDGSSGTLFSLRFPASTNEHHGFKESGVR